MRPVILLVEDRADDRYLLRWLLASVQARIVEAGDGQSALAAATQPRGRAGGNRGGRRHTL